MKKTFYKITNRSTHPSISTKILKDLQEGKEIRLKLMDAGSFRSLESVFKQVLKSSKASKTELEIFMYPVRSIFHPQGKIDRYIISTKTEQKRKIHAGKL